MSHKRIVGLAAGIAALVGCAPPEVLPEELYGMWANQDAGEWRVFQFAALSDEFANPNFYSTYQAYQVYQYPDGGEPVVVQWGTYAVNQGMVLEVDDGYAREIDNVLITTATGSADGQLGTFTNPIFASSDNALTLYSESAASGRRHFTREVDLP